MKIKRLLIFFLVILLLALLSIYYPKITGNPTEKTSVEYPKEPAILERVIDGDTLVVSGESIGSHTHIRILGINAPEKGMPFSGESASFMKQFVNKTIELLRDKDDTDMYKRKLRYVFYGDRLLDQESLRQGLSSSYYYSGLKYEKNLLEAESQARQDGIGIWTHSNEPCSTSNCIILKELNYSEEFFIIKNNCGFECNLSGWFVKDAGRNTFYLSSMKPSEEKTYPSPKNKDVWNNNGDRFFMFDEKGFLVIYEVY